MIVQLCQQEFPPEFGRNTARFRGVGLMANTPLLPHAEHSIKPNVMPELGDRLRHNTAEGRVQLFVDRSPA